MASIQTINVTDTAKLSKAIRSGKPFYIADKDDKMLAHDPEMEAAEKELIAALEEAENCKTRCTIKEFWDYADKL